MAGRSLDRGGCAVSDWLASQSDVECCYLTTTGRTSGLPREIEIWFGVIDSTLYLISGNGPTADWYRNLVADSCGHGADRGGFECRDRLESSSTPTSVDGWAT